jgi:hypothetical protein
MRRIAVGNSGKPCAGWRSRVRVRISVHFAQILDSIIQVDVDSGRLVA